MSGSTLVYVVPHRRRLDHIVIESFLNAVTIACAVMIVVVPTVLVTSVVFMPIHPAFEPLFVLVRGGHSQPWYTAHHQERVRVMSACSRDAVRDIHGTDCENAAISFAEDHYRVVRGDELEVARRIWNAR